MVQRVAIDDVRSRIGDLLDIVHDTNEAVIVERNGEPIAALISPEDFEEFQRQRIERAWETVRCVQKRNADQDPDAVLAVVTQVVEEVRQEMYDERIRAEDGR